MTILEHLTPELIDWLIMAVALMINVGLLAILSNFLVDFSISSKKQTAIFGWHTATLIFFLLLIASAQMGLIELHPTLYPNKYDFLLVGVANGFAALGGGLAVGIAVGRLWGDRDRLRIALGSSAIVTDMLIAILVILWLTHQT